MLALLGMHSLKRTVTRLYTCSRSGEVKVWDIREEVKLIMAVKQKYPVGGVLSYPNDSNKLITIDRQTDIRVWDINLKKVIDGPFQGEIWCRLLVYQIT